MKIRSCLRCNASMLFLCIPVSEEERDAHGFPEKLVTIDPQKLTPEQWANGIDPESDNPCKYVVLCECSGRRFATPEQAVNNWHNG